MDKEHLLKEWDLRKPQQWGEDVVLRLNYEISLLQSLQSFGCEETNDGLPVHFQIEERLRVLKQLRAFK